MMNCYLHTTLRVFVVEIEDVVRRKHFIVTRPQNDNIEVKSVQFSRGDDTRNDRHRDAPCVRYMALELAKN